MCTLQWHSMRLVVMTLALLGITALPARGDVVSDGPKVGQWKTWVLTSGKEIQVPAPPADTSDQTKAELAELRQLQKERSPITNTAIPSKLTARGHRGPHRQIRQRFPRQGDPEAAGPLFGFRASADARRHGGGR